MDDRHRRNENRFNLVRSVLSLLPLSRSFVFNVRYNDAYDSQRRTNFSPRYLSTWRHIKRQTFEEETSNVSKFLDESSIYSQPSPPSSPSAPEIVSILTRFTIAPRLKSCLMHSIDSQSKLDEQSARSNNDVIGYFARDARMERIFHGKREGGGVRRMDGRN